MRARSIVISVIAGAAGFGIVLVAHGDAGRKHVVPPSPEGNLVVALCDGDTTVEVPGVSPGHTLPRGQAQGVADDLMREWQRKNPDVQWIAQTGDPRKQGHIPNSSAGQKMKPRQPVLHRGTTASSGAEGVGAKKAVKIQDGHTYGAFSKRDEAIWAASTQAFVDEGNRIFHDAQRLGGTVGISCDMCHPDGANTHPETYPKYQVQLGRVALLRDMINWCVENPVRGKPLADDDPRMKALEAYIYAQRRGVPLQFGKH